MHVFIASSLTLALLFTSPAWADTSEVLTLEEAESMAIQQNPGLAASAANARALAQMPAQAGSLPDPKIGLKAMNLPVDSFSATQENMTQMQLVVSQAIPFPGKLDLKAEAAERMAESALRDREEFGLVLLRNVRIHWWNLAYLDKALSIIRQNQDLLRNLVKVTETKYKTGKGLQQDVLLAQLELSKLLERELKLQATRQRENATLNALLGRPADMAITPDRQDSHDLQALSIDVAALKQWARSHRPMLQAMDSMIQAADSKLALARKNYYPDFKLGAAYGFRSGINMANRKSRPDFATFMLSMNVPLYTNSKQDRAVDQRVAEKAKAEFLWQDAVNRVDAAIDAAASDLRIARDQVALFENGILPQARQTTASMLAGYQVNKVDFLNVVRAQLNEFNTDIQHWQQVTLAHQAEARLTAAAGKKNLPKDVLNHE